MYSSSHLAQLVRSVDGFWHRYEVLGLRAVKCRASRLPPYQSPEISQQLGFIIALLSVDSCLPAIAKIHHLRRCTKVTIISNPSLQQPLAQVHSKGSPAKPLSLLSLSSFFAFFLSCAKFSFELHFHESSLFFFPTHLPLPPTRLAGPRLSVGVLQYLVDFPLAPASS